VVAEAFAADDNRIIRELEDELYVVRVPHRPGYALGPGVLKFGMNAHLRLLAANRAMLAALAREVNENVELAIFSGREVVVVDQIASPDRLRGVTQIGRACGWSTRRYSQPSRWSSTRSPDIWISPDIRIMLRRGLSMGEFVRRDADAGRS